ncbi:TIGR01459 family HAD-type hydrolase [Silicimonas algicola]|uniref:HAD superfamily hydrolase (TIGR01459 family) n=1 Tax=Silicimonas algicola TaxID=1826607 RepID=A0A316GP01_9RHOB|nr:TIGR01459 family HAD-type hydrolase [Silicimonas algicola]AZQ65720.1 TIGR01459 family HAD-type hydrolase [Silicimonas algicola]PWK56667.1 HAD superfamily hydrolase (TIGR01459 family) [Silicimonas algicola]
MTEIIESLADVSDRYDAVFCDLWGCLHDGIRAFPEAVEALRRFKSKGGRVVLLTNAPRPRADVARQLDRFGVPTDCWDTIATSGDSARVAMFDGVIGDKVWFMGQDYDLTFFEPPKIVSNPTPVTRVPLDQATGIACLGPFEPHAEPSVNRPEFLYAKQKGLKLLCANPDIVVDRGESREWCAGALAALYTEMGGESLYFGKPHPPVYTLARQRLSELGADIPDSRILCIGDGINTDIQGALGEDLDSLFITGGLAKEETRTDRQPEAAALDSFVAQARLTPTYAIGYLR